MNESRPTRRPPPRVFALRRILAALAGVAALVAITIAVVVLLDEDPVVPDDYDESVGEQFLSVCTADATNLGFAAPRAFCSCSFDRIRAEVPYEQFVEFDTAMREDPGAVPDVIDRIRTDCFVGTASVTPTTAVSAETTTADDG